MATLTPPRLRGAQTDVPESYGQATPAHHRYDLTPQVSLWHSKPLTRGRLYQLGDSGDVQRARDAQPHLDALEARREAERITTPCQTDPEAWWPTTYAEIAAAESACLDCPLFVECARYADALQPTGGVWAGRDHGSLEGMAHTTRRVRGRRTTDHAATTQERAEQ